MIYVIGTITAYIPFMSNLLPPTSNDCFRILVVSDGFERESIAFSEGYICIKFTRQEPFQR